MTVDKAYCASSFLMYRTIADEQKIFYPGMNTLPRFKIDFPRTPVTNADELLEALGENMREWTKDKKTAIALSGGIDSGILAKFMPEGSMAYTFQCVVPGTEVMSDVPQAKKYAEECGLRHKVIDIYWEDLEEFTPILMSRKGEPIHSIEVQIYKAALQAKKDGFEQLVFGEGADINYGGLSKLLSKDWTFGEFADRYSYVKPYHVLRNWRFPTEPIEKYTKDGFVDVNEFLHNFYIHETMGSYTNPCELVGLGIVTPYFRTCHPVPLDMARIRSGESKYIVREAFKKLYNNFAVPDKIPMPRATNEWLKNWTGPTRPEFWPHCTDHMTGDQKWLVWCLEKFFNMMEKN